jgi:hypothetical protein
MKIQNNSYINESTSQNLLDFLLDKIPKTHTHIYIYHFFFFFSVGRVMLFSFKLFKGFKRSPIPCGVLHDHKEVGLEKLDWTFEGSR